MNEKIESFYKALKRLEEALLAPAEGLNIDGLIQRFEFTYELAWKALKIAVFKEGIECNSPRECFKAGFQLGYIDDEQAWLDMIGDRNMTSHIYDEKQALHVCANIKKLHFQQFKLLKNKLESKF